MAALVQQQLFEMCRQSEFARKRLADMKRRRSRKKVALLVTMVSVLSMLASDMFAVSPRSMWMRPRSSRWWEDVVLTCFEPHDWIENFRMSKDTFLYLCEQLRPLIQKKTTRLRKPISTECRVAITIWVLATTSEYRSVAHLFGVARNTVSVIVRETCLAIVQKLLPLYVKFPMGDGLKDVITGFKDKFGVPCAGSIDGSHIAVKPPAMNHTDFYNRKGWYSMLVQAVVDHNLLFRNLCIGWPGSVHDARVLANSTLFRKVSNGELLEAQGAIEVQGHNLSPLLLGDSAYPLLLWLIKPFSFSSSLTPQQKLCNYRLSRARVVVEVAFGRLKG